MQNSEFNPHSTQPGIKYNSAGGRQNLIDFLKPKSHILLGLIWGFCLLLIIFIWVNHFTQVKSDKDDTIAAAIEKNSNLAVALENFALTTVRNADAVLKLIRFEYLHTGSQLDIDKVLFAHDVNKSFFQGCAILDSKGKMLHNNLKLNGDSALNFFHREYFLHHHNNTADTLFISKPFVSKTIGKAVISFSRRINNADGSFNGVVVLQIEPRIFTSFYAQANLRKYDIISLISTEKITLARRTGNIESFGEFIGRSPLFDHLKKKPVDSYYAKDAIRGIQTYFSYRKLNDFPIIATVGSTEADILENYYTRASRDQLSAIVISVFVILFAILVTMIMRYRKRMANKLVLDEQDYRRKVTEQVILAQEKEREVIGRELHDNVNQVLTTVKLYLEMAFENKGPKETLIEKSMKHVNDCIHEIRKLSQDLSAPTLGTKSLIDSISALVEMVASSGRLNIRFMYDHYHQTISMDQKLALYRIVQEQLNNIIKHSGAKNAWITLSQNERFTTLTIKDDGNGFDTTATRSGIGINNIKSRVNVFNGDVMINSSIGKGCLIFARIPLSEKKAKTLNREVYDNLN